MRKKRFKACSVFDMKVNEFIFKRDIIVRNVDDHIVSQDRSNTGRGTENGK
ncbi:hypothetical protein [Sporomusa aerivorans]|uniref:hypothetical protein n=1 Tax=Sporomusa aerivorans TaxID=204936 RepID=UPI00352A498A